MDPLPSITKAFSMVIQQEWRFDSPKATDLDANKGTTVRIFNVQAKAGTLVEVHGGGARRSEQQQNLYQLWQNQPYIGVLLLYQLHMVKKPT